MKMRDCPSGCGTVDMYGSEPLFFLTVVKSTCAIYKEYRGMGIISLVVQLRWICARPEVQRGPVIQHYHWKASAR